MGRQNCRGCGAGTCKSLLYRRVRSHLLIFSDSVQAWRWRSGLLYYTGWSKRCFRERAYPLLLAFKIFQLHDLNAINSCQPVQRVTFIAYRNKSSMLVLVLLWAFHGNFASARSQPNTERAEKIIPLRQPKDMFKDFLRVVLSWNTYCLERTVSPTGYTTPSRYDASPKLVDELLVLVLWCSPLPYSHTIIFQIEK